MKVLESLEKKKNAEMIKQLKTNKMKFPHRFLLGRLCVGQDALHSVKV